jgi:hypothetical protein
VKSVALLFLDFAPVYFVPDKIIFFGFEATIEIENIILFLPVLAAGFLERSDSKLKMPGASNGEQFVIAPHS